MSGGTAVFAGPTITARQVHAIDPDARVLPPAAHGDLYAVALDEPEVIVLVDGVFDWVRAVWHKEILWALAHGVRVIGASSMGALRAAECAEFGMEPCGRIAAEYVQGVRTSDGDVAQAHATADDEWRPLSEALVNVDATLHAAHEQGVVDGLAVEALWASARACFYADRTWPLIVAGAGLDERDRRAILAWLPSGRIDQKRLDAEAAVALALTSTRPLHPTFALAETTFWMRAVAQMVPPRIVRVDLATILADA